MSNASSIHVSVMADEIVRWLNPQPGQTLLDGTLGGGGHTRLLAERLEDNGRVIALDRDPQPLQRAEQSLAGLPVMVAQSNFCDAAEVLAEIDVPQVDGIVLDLGLSSDQLQDRTRGFSFESDGDLDLRFDTASGEPAWRLLANMGEESLANLIYEYGEERRSRRIAREIVARRRTQPIRTALELADLVRRCVPAAKTRQRIHPATRTFQALRIAVNAELKSLEIALRRLPDLLASGGRLAIISFHSLEDRRVKEAFRDDSRLQILTRKPLRPSDAETTANPRSRSAKLRVAEKVANPQAAGQQKQYPERIVSGGQTGVDRAALDVAIERKIPHGGWCPAGRKAEDGAIADCYQLRETSSAEYQVRTEQNVIDSDATLIFYRDTLSGGTLLTLRMAKKHRRPCLQIDLKDGPNAGKIRKWLRENAVATLNIAGPRESSAPGIARQAHNLLAKILVSTGQAKA